MHHQTCCIASGMTTLVVKRLVARTLALGRAAHESEPGEFGRRWPSFLLTGSFAASRLTDAHALVARGTEANAVALVVLMSIWLLARMLARGMHPIAARIGPGLA